MSSKHWWRWRVFDGDGQNKRELFLAAVGGLRQRKVVAYKARTHAHTHTPIHARALTCMHARKHGKHIYYWQCKQVQERPTE